MWNEAVNTIIKKISQRYPKLEREEIVFAKVTLRTDQDNGLYSYNIKILTRNMEIDSKYPEMTKILAKTKYEVGQTVVLAMLYGQEGYILGEYYG